VKPEVLVLLGDFAEGQTMLSRLAWKFGWSIRKAATSRDLRQVAREAQVVGVFLNTARWQGDVRGRVRETCSAAAGGRVVACHRFRDANRFDHELPDGTFYTLALPLDESEVRQSLGYLSEAVARDGALRAGKKAARKAASSSVAAQARELAS
jgi:hypothetical protein